MTVLSWLTSIDPNGSSEWFVPSAVVVRASNENVGERIATVDRWLERANQKEAVMGLRTEEKRRRRQEMAQEHSELMEVNERWAKL